MIQIGAAMSTGLGILFGKNLEDCKMTNGITLQQLEEERRVCAEKLLAEMDAVAERFPEKSNVVAEIRRLRKQRTRQIWENVSTPV